MSLDITQIERLASLARLELTAEEKATYAGQLAEILDYFKKLQELDTTDIEPLSQVINLQNVFRSDEANPGSPELTKKIIDHAPAQSGRHIRVKKIL